MDVKLPDHAISALGPVAGFDWATAEWKPTDLAGLLYSGIAVFTGAIILTTDLDVDIDGPGGDRATDRYWQPETSLKSAAGKSCDSREFPGYVMSPKLREFGVRIGDFGLASWGGELIALQIYDEGPASKAGEGSIRLARELGLVQSHESDHLAANGGHAHSGANDISAVIFPRSAPGTGESIANHALPVDLISKAAFALYYKVSGSDRG